MSLVEERAWAAPDRVEQAIELLRRADPWVLVAGGTDLMLARAQVPPDRPILSLHALRPELRFISVQKDRVKVGALATLDDLVRSAGVAARVPVLAAAARQVGDAALRHRATVGGNLARWARDGDTLAAWTALGADVHVRGPAGARTITLTQGDELRLRRDELIVSVHAPLPPAKHRQYFGRLVDADTSERLVLAGVLEVERGAVRTVRMAVGSPRTGTTRLLETEAVLGRGRLSPPLVQEAVRTAAREVPLPEAEAGPMEHLMRTFLSAE